MNKRIKELYKQAYGHFPSRIEKPDTEKFVELILIEVIATIYGSDIKDKKQDKLVDKLFNKFGIK